MTTLYVVESGYRDFEFIVGVFDSYESAVKFADSFEYADGGEDIYVFECKLNESVTGQDGSYWPVVYKCKAKAILEEPSTSEPNKVE